MHQNADKDSRSCSGSQCRPKPQLQQMGRKKQRRQNHDNKRSEELRAVLDQRSNRATSRRSKQEEVVRGWSLTSPPRDQGNKRREKETGEKPLRQKQSDSHRKWESEEAREELQKRHQHLRGCRLNQERKGQRLVEWRLARHLPKPLPQRRRPRW